MPSREEEKKQKIHRSVSLLVLDFFIVGIMLLTEYVFHLDISNALFYNIVGISVGFFSFYAFFELLDAVAWDIM